MAFGENKEDTLHIILMTLQAGYCFLDALILIPKVLSDP